MIFEFLHPLKLVKVVFLMCKFISSFPPQKKEREFAECLKNRYGHIEAVSYLLVHGANVDGVNATMQTPFLYAAWQGHNDIASVLPPWCGYRCAGQFLNPKNKHVGMVRLLLDTLADRRMVSNEGLSSHAMACSLRDEARMALRS